MMSTSTKSSGYTLSELTITLALMSMLAAVSLPAGNQLRRRVELDMVSRRVGTLLMRCRATAILKHRTTGLVFERGATGAWRCYLAADGDGDGIRRDDLDTLRDPILGEVVDLQLGHAGLGILGEFGVPDPGGRGPLAGELDDPIRAGQGDIISFTPQGTARPSSVYLTDHHQRMRVLRIIGSTGRIRALEWQVGWPAWQRVNA